jgi:hypothetical protein
VMATTPNSVSAATIATTMNVVSFISRPYKGSYRLGISATRLQNKT